ncbi:hypothetical protein EV421DRAFT_1898187 [Armillaria borealis]|uniref:Uncharacterized protein n=1 Tax=Armillaria borealis TaxID=47425 RepID=A0AA39N0A5_9AGAR|nr:hypothetical protein EV421DRAFT_1898187 [Armillaria borealis]
MPNSDSDACTSSTTSTSDSMSRSSSNTSASSVASQHPIAVEWAKWEDRLYENVPPMPENLFDYSARLILAFNLLALTIL